MSRTAIATTAEMTSGMRAPKMTRLSTSRPRLSVPKGWSAARRLEPLCRFEAPRPCSGYGAIHGAATATTTMRTIQARPTTASRSRKKTRTLWRVSAIVDW